MSVSIESFTCATWQCSRQAISHAISHLPKIEYIYIDVYMYGDGVHTKHPALFSLLLFYLVDLPKKKHNFVVELQHQHLFPLTNIPREFELIAN